MRTTLAGMLIFVSEEWEWRYFKPIASVVIGSHCRTDVYFPAGARVGLKLRDRDESVLEAKLLTKEDGDVGLWRKVLVPYDLGYIRHITDNALDLSQLDSGVRVECRKHKRPTPTGEYCVCNFEVFLPRQQSPSLVESFESVSVEVGEPNVIRQHLPRLPDGATVASFPQIVSDLTRRAMNI